MHCCSIKNCNNEVYQDDKCILHYNNTLNDDDSERIAKQNYELVLSYIKDALTENFENYSDITESDIDNYLTGRRKPNAISPNEFTSRLSLKFNGIVFHDTTSVERYDYTKLFQLLNDIYFINCDFQICEIEPKDTKYHYTNCRFHSNWRLNQSLAAENKFDTIYRKCNFIGHTTLVSVQRESIDTPFFLDCDFNTLTFASANFKVPIFLGNAFYKTKVKVIDFANCKFSYLFNLYNFEVERVNITNSELLYGMQISNCSTIDKLSLNNSIFSGETTISNSFNSIKITNCTFNDPFNLSGSDIFTKENDSIPTAISGCTFKNIADFSDVRYNSGLKITGVNLQVIPNFLNSHVEAKYTDRETFRIIKNSFDSVGNHIEANRYFVQEMCKYQEELKGTGLTQERVIFWLNRLSSNFGQSYLLPMFWLLFYGVVYYFIKIGHENNILYKILPCCNNVVDHIAVFANGIASSIIPFKNFVDKGMESISLIFYAIFAALVWQFIVAVKRHAKR